MLPVSKDTLLRVVRRRAAPAGVAPVRVLGIDDFAWKRGQRYGTLMCDLERRRIIDLLPDREATTVKAWLAGHPEISVVSRDRGGGYGPAGGAGRRPLALDGERQRRTPGGATPVNAPDPVVARLGGDRSSAADLRRAPSI
jgi:hypothetical protein